MAHKFIFLTFFIFISTANIHAAEIHLKNGDRISGKIIEETASEMIIETRAMGKISIDRNFIKEEKEVKVEAVKKEGDVQWRRHAGCARFAGAGAAAVVRDTAGMGRGTLLRGSRDGDRSPAGQARAARVRHAVAVPLGPPLPLHTV